MNKLIIIGLLTLGSVSCFAQDIQLPSPNRTGGKPLMDALNERQSNRDFSDKELSMQTLSDLLWAAYGFNRETKRTVPSSQDRQEIDLYVFLKTGVYFYDAKNQQLILKIQGDYRAKTGVQPFVEVAPLNFVFVANLDKASNRDAALTDCGFIAQNIYLFCASEDLISVVRGSVKKEEVHDLLGLNEKQEVLLAQTVGYKQ
ncbi:MAG: SagB/ThcOx family dehydrogenase [Candidatus Azobacteroides sp.]|nr:SagB/ThcOx family dehydrogenase [Candidatus Azobacteroides sp.]